MGKNLYFDYAAMIIEMVLLGCMLLRKMTNGKMNRAFILLVSVAILTNAMDIIAVSYDKLNGLFVMEKMIYHSMYLLLRAYTSFFCLSYVIMLTDTWFKASNNFWKKLMLFLPIAVVTGGMIINIFTHHIFYIDPNGLYVRGPLFLILYIINGYYAAYGFVKVFMYRKMLSLAKIFSIYTGSLLMMSAAAVQFLMPDVLIDMFANATGLLFLFMMIQRPEEITDSETGLIKLSAYDKDLERSLQNKKPETIIMIRILNFTVIREMLGYRDTVCVKRMMASAILQMMKELRVHGDVYYTESGNYRIKLEGKQTEKATPLAEHINTLYKTPLKYKEMQLNLVVCVCITKIPTDIDTLEGLIALSNDLRNKYSGNVLYASRINSRVRYNMMHDMDRILEDALSNHEFEVYYQPIYSVEKQRFLSAEALLRLHTKQYGYISPDLFIPVAEKNGMIHKIGLFVMEEVCRFIGSDEYQQLGLEYIEINLSPAQCMENNLANNVIHIMNDHHVLPSQLNLEITETASGNIQDIVMDNIHTLHDAGISFSLDDFGTGYSNMTRIASMPFHIIKLDKTFTNIENNPNLVIVLENVIKMIKALNMKIVVEGIETKEMVKTFSDLECEYIQGYYYSKPLPKHAFVEFILAHQYNRPSVRLPE